MFSNLSIELKLELLNKKMDTVIELFKKENKKKIKKNDLANIWSVEYYKESLLIKFTYNIEFKDFIKELGGDWLFSKKGWLFSKSSESELINAILKKWDIWTFNDFRK